MFMVRRWCALSDLCKLTQKGLNSYICIPCVNHKSRPWTHVRKNRIKAATTIFLVFFQKCSKWSKATHSVETTGWGKLFPAMKHTCTITLWDFFIASDKSNEWNKTSQWYKAIKTQLWALRARLGKHEYLYII